MTDISREESDDELLTEVVEKSSVGIGAFIAERLLLAGFAYAVTAGFGAVIYGFISVLTRGETLSRNLVAGLGDGYSRTLPRVSVAAQRTLLSVGTVGFVGVWAIIAALVTVFREQIVAATLLKPRHEPILILFAVGLLPFLLLRNFRDVFRAVRRIRLAMLVSRVFKPAALLAGVTLVILFSRERSLFNLWGGIVAAILVFALAGGCLLVWYTRLNFGSVRSQRPVVSSFVQFTADATGVAVLELVQRRAVFIVMALYLTPLSAGAFSLSIVFAIVVRWPLSGVNGILPPIAAGLYSDGRTQTLQRLYQQTSRLATVATTPMFVLGFIYAPDLLAVFNDAYAREADVLRIALVAQYAATVYGSVGLLLLMTNNERASLFTQIINASVALPLMVVLTLQLGPIGLGIAYLLSILINNTTELLVLYSRDGLTPFSREQFYAVLSAPIIIYFVVSLKTVVGVAVSLAVAVVVLGLYSWLGRQFLLRTAERDAVRSLLS